MNLETDYCRQNSRKGSRSRGCQVEAIVGVFRRAKIYLIPFCLATDIFQMVACLARDVLLYYCSSMRLQSISFVALIAPRPWPLRPTFTP